VGGTIDRRNNIIIDINIMSSRNRYSNCCPKPCYDQCYNSCDPCFTPCDPCKIIVGPTGPPGPAGPVSVLNVYQSVTQGVTASIPNIIVFDQTLFNTNFNTNTTRFQPTVAGFYNINATIGINGITGEPGTIDGINNVSIRKNGVTILASTNTLDAVNLATTNTTTILAYMTGIDYIEVLVTPVNTTTLVAGQSNTYLTAALVK